MTLCSPGERSVMANNMSVIAEVLESFEVGRILLSSVTVYVQLLVPRRTIPFPGEGVSIQYKFKLTYSN